MQNIDLSLQALLYGKELCPESVQLASSTLEFRSTGALSNRQNTQRGESMPFGRRKLELCLQILQWVP